jgi:hypothetical protein
MKSKIMAANMNKFQVSSPFFLGLAIIIMAPALLFSQGQLSVIITDSDQRPLPGVAVEICSPALERILIGITDASGVCHFKDLPAGPYQIKCGSAGYKTIIQKNIRINSTPVTLKLSRVEEYLIEEYVDFVERAVDPNITSFTSRDAILLSETSSSLHESIESTWDQMAVADDVCDRREILKEASKNWRDVFKKTKNKLTDFTQSHEKRFMINAIFDGILKHTRSDLNSIHEFDQNALRLRAELCAIANYLKRVAETGKATFDLRVETFPKDVKLTYSYVRGLIKEHHEHTPTTIKNLYYAPCRIGFRQEGRTSAVSVPYDPYDFLEAGTHQVRMHLLDKSQWGSSYQNAPSLEERVRQSDLIIVGEVQQIECRRNEEISDIYTYVTVSVEERIKGSDILKENEIVIKKLGGSIKEEGIVQYVERHPAGLSQPGFEKRKKVLLMLKLLPDSLHYEVVAGQHGKFSILKGDIIAERYVSLKEFIQKIKEFMKSQESLPACNGLIHIAANQQDWLWQP